MRSFKGPGLLGHGSGGSVFRRPSRRQVQAPLRRRRAAVERLEARELLAVFGPTPQVASELSVLSIPASSRPEAITAVGRLAFFTAFEPERGAELWKSDGTASGTTLVRDIIPGPNGSFPQHLIELEGMLYFCVSNGLWESDGTETGTVKIADFNAPPAWMAKAGGRLFLMVNGPQGTELWTSRGNTGGSVQLLQFDFVAGNPHMTDVDGVLYFAAQDFIAREQLWKSDGTALGTMLVQDFSQSTPSPFPFSNGIGEMLGVGGDVYFSRGASYTELWTSDGDDAAQLERFEEALSDLTEVNGVLYLISKKLLYKTDGSPGGARQVLSNPDESIESLTHLGGVLYVVSHTPQPPLDDVLQQIWSLDAIEHRTDVHQAVGSYFTDLAWSNGQVYFIQHRPTDQLWTTDGAPDGARLVRELAPTDHFFIHGLTPVQDRLFFSQRDDAHGQEPWVSDGSPAGTSLLKDVNADTVPRGIVASVEWKGATFLIVGTELWRTDGTAGGTVLLAEGLASYRPILAVAGERLFFSTDSAIGRQVWKTDGTVGGASLVLPNGGPFGVFDITEFAGAVYFLAYDPTTRKLQLWQIDGTVDGASRVNEFPFALPDLFPTLDAPLAAGLHVAGGTMYVDASDSFWSSTGTPDGTVLLSDVTIEFGGLASIAGGAIYSAIQTDLDLVAIAKTDGTPASTTVLKTLPPIYDQFGSQFNGSGRFTSVGGVALFFNVDSVDGAFRWFETELWATDGTVAGTKLLRNFGETLPDELVVLGDKLYFVADDGGTGKQGKQLWRSDGTAAGTVPITNLNPGGFNPTHLTVIDGELLFSANDGVHGDEPWSSDGTAEGTVMMADLVPGGRGSRPNQFLQMGNQILITTDDGPFGSERWVVSSLSVRTGQFVAAVYDDVLGRAPDSAGLAYWSERAAQRAELASVAAAISHSDEYYSTFIIQPAYLKYLGRAADDDGLAHWLSQMREGVTDEQLEALLIASDEFYGQAGGTDAVWLDALYRDILGRSADGEGAAHWSGRLSGGVTRRQVALGFTASLEREMARVNDAYLRYLGRGADPEGLAYWLSQSAAGKTNEDLIAAFTATDEYYALHTQ